MLPLNPHPRSRPLHHPPLSPFAPTIIPSTSPILPFLHLVISHSCSSPKLPLLFHSVRTVFMCLWEYAHTILFFLHLPSLTSLYSPSLSLRASRECQNKERLLEQRFRAALRDFQQWLVDAKISTAKCFDVPQSVAEASTALQRIQVRDFFLALIYSSISVQFLMVAWNCGHVEFLPWCFGSVHFWCDHVEITLFPSQSYPVFILFLLLEI